MNSCQYHLVTVDIMAGKLPSNRSVNRKKVTTAFSNILYKTNSCVYANKKLIFLKSFKGKGAFLYFDSLSTTNGS